MLNAPRAIAQQRSYHRAARRRAHNVTSSLCAPRGALYHGSNQHRAQWRRRRKRAGVATTRVIDNGD